MPRLRCLAVAIVLFTLFVPATIADDWPMFRGPHGNGASRETDFSTKWEPKEGPKVLWAGNVGRGAANVVIADGKLYAIGNRNEADSVYCIDAESGKQQWSRSYPCPLDTRQFTGGPAATPTLDGDHLYTLSHQGHLYCWDVSNGGKVVWSTHVVRKLKGQRPQWGYAGSPLVEGDMLVLDIGGVGTSTVALNKKTGRIVWRAGSDGAGYATPVAFDRSNGKRGLILFKARRLVGLDAETGKELWHYDWRTSHGVNAATPIFHDGKLFITSGYNRGCALLQIKDDEAKEIYRSDELRCHFNNPVLHDGYVYGADDGGRRARKAFKCIDFNTGKLQWDEPRLGRSFTLIAGDKLIVQTEVGQLVVAEASPKGFKRINSFRSMEAKAWTAPVLANGLLFCRNNVGNIRCFDLRKDK